MKRIELIHVSPKTWWEESWTTDDACINFVSNSSTAFISVPLMHLLYGEISVKVEDLDLK